MERPDIREILGLACEATRSDLIVRGRHELALLIEAEGVELVEALAYAHLDLSDEWEYCRLAEVFATTDREALSRLIEFGLRSSDAGVLDAAADLKIKYVRKA